MSKYFIDRHCWSEDTFLSIDWLASNKEYKQLPTGHRLASFKLQNRLWPTYTILYQRQPTQSPTCPRCCLDPETHNHVLCCLQVQTSWLQQWFTVATILKSTLKIPSPIYDALERGIRSWQEGDPDLQWPFPLPSDNDPVDQAIFLAYTKQSSIGWSHTLHGHICLHWGAAMSTCMQYRAPYKPFKPTQWTRTLIRTLHKYTYSQWTDRNNTVYRATLTASRATHRISLKTHIKEAYHNSSTILVDKWIITFGILLTLQLEQTTATMEAQLLQYQAGQKHLANILTHERH